jgi:hypothetical protein
MRIRWCINLNKKISFAVTIPIVAWRNSLGQFLSIDDDNHGILGFSDGRKHDNIIIPKPEQLFLFVPHPGNYRFN